MKIQNIPIVRIGMVRGIRPLYRIPMKSNRIIFEDYSA
jgi:hypothetical protein